MQVDSICILGGTGFVGSHLCNRLTQRRTRLRVLTRDRNAHRDLLVIPNVELVEIDPHDTKELHAQFVGMDAVINLVGTLNERRRGEFERVHVELVRKIVDGCRAVGIKRLLHMSALGASADSTSRYQRTKAEGERIALSASSDQLAVTAFRPSVIFGLGDSFFTRFAALLRMAPGFFPLPTPQARFAPVHVSDVAEAFARSLPDRATAGRRYELCGPRSYTLKQLVEYTARTSGQTPRIVGLPDWAARLQARVLGALPGQLYTMDNFHAAETDSLCRQDGLAELGITDRTSVEAAVPYYLADMTSRHRYYVFRRGRRV